jgi:outer membrane biosynthesis protein TonB
MSEEEEVKEMTYEEFLSTFQADGDRFTAEIVAAMESFSRNCERLESSVSSAQEMVSGLEEAIVNRVKEEDDDEDDLEEEEDEDEEEEDEEEESHEEEKPPKKRPSEKSFKRKKRDRDDERPRKTGKKTKGSIGQKAFNTQAFGFSN